MNPAETMPRGIYRFADMERVIYGIPFAEALEQEVARLGAASVYVLASGTLARQTDTVEQLRRVLGGRFAGLHARIGAHTPRPDVVDAANAARRAKADLLVTVGGGSITDAAKMVGLCLGNAVTEPGQLDRYAARIGEGGALLRPPTQPSPVRSVAIPTTLSAGEYIPTAGCLDPSSHLKEDYAHPTMMPRSVILDPAATLHTPEWLFLSTGVRAVDHAIEDFCSIESQPFSNATSLHALRLLSKGLPAVKLDPGDLAARLDCQLGSWLSMTGGQAGIPKGASHAIGHILGGTAGVPHGYTSCVMLPAVLEFNLEVNARRQALISEAFGRPGEPAARLVAELVRLLGLPTRLRDVGVRADQLDLIAERSMQDAWTHTNPRKIETPAAVRTILDAAW